MIYTLVLISLVWSPAAKHSEWAGLQIVDDYKSMVRCQEEVRGMNMTVNTIAVCIPVEVK